MHTNGQASERKCCAFGKKNNVGKKKLCFKYYLLTNYKIY